MGSGQGTPVAPPTFTNVPIADFYTQIWPNVPLCPNPKIREALIDSARRFLQRTELWTVELPVIDITADEPEYVVASNDGQMVSLDHYEILNGDTFYRKTVISEIAISENPEERDDWRSQTTEDPDAGWVNQTLKLRLTYIPNVTITGGLKVWLNIMPFDSATVFPSILWSHYKDEIVAGALSELLLMVNKPWSNPDMAAAYGIGFEEAILPARQKKFSGFVRHRIRDVITTKYTDF